eukprot:2528820-Rhodomonas_salina.1
MVYGPRPKEDTSTPLEVGAWLPHGNDLSKLPNSSFKALLKERPVGVNWDLGLPKTLGNKAFMLKMQKLPDHHHYVSKLWGVGKKSRFMVKTDYSARGRGGKSRQQNPSVKTITTVSYRGLSHTPRFPLGRPTWIPYTYPVVKNVYGIPPRVLEDHHIHIGSFFSSPFKKDFSVSSSEIADLECMHSRSAPLI